MKTNHGGLLAREESVREFYLRGSITKFDCVIERSPAKFILLLEILTKEGENLVRVGQGPVSLIEFERAAELKPDWSPPYARISDYYKSVGDKERPVRRSTRDCRIRRMHRR